MSARTRVLREFLEYTGADTLSAIEVASTTRAKIVHGLFALACLGVLSAECVSIVQQYNRYETDTYVEVTICNESFTQKEATILRIL